MPPYFFGLFLDGQQIHVYPWLSFHKNIQNKMNLFLLSSSLLALAVRTTSKKRKVILTHCHQHAQRVPICETFSSLEISDDFVLSITPFLLEDGNLVCYDQSFFCQADLVGQTQRRGNTRSNRQVSKFWTEKF